MSASSKKKLRKEQEVLQMTEKQQQAKKEAKRLKIYTITFITVLVLVLVAFVGSRVYNHLDESGFLARHDTVLEVNDHDISAVELNYFYMDAISNQYNTWYNQFQDQTYMMLTYMYGLDVTKPLNQVYYDTENKVTWAEMFANQAVYDATEVYTLYDAAKESGHKMTAEEKENIKIIMENTEAAAKSRGFKNMAEYLQAMYGKGANKETYRTYLNSCALANSYRTAYSDSLNYTADDYKEYLTKNPNEFSTFNYTTYQLSVSNFYQGGTKDESTGAVTYTDAEKAAAEAACKEAADSIKAANPTDAASLNAAIANLSIYKQEPTAEGEEKKIPESTSNTDVSYGYLSTHYRDWVSDASRKSGDFTIVPITSTSTAADGTEKTVTTGYYAVIFDGRDDHEEKMVDIRHILVPFQGGVADADGKTVYTDAEKLAAKQKAEEVMALYNATGKTEEDFAALVIDNSSDPGSLYNGGLYEHVLEGQMVKGFNEWIFDEVRKNGDCEIVETELGYHLIYFVNTDELTYRSFMIDSTLRNENVAAWVKAQTDKAKVGEKDFSKLDLDFVISPTSY